MSTNVEVGGGEVSALPEIAARSPLELFWRRLRRDYVAIVSLGFIAFLTLVAIFAGPLVKLLGAHPPNEQNSKITEPFGLAASPSGDYLFGSDDLGRDVLSRVIYGARVSMFAALVSTAIVVVIGVTIGMIAGYYRGRTDTLLSRAMDLQLAFPVLLLALGIGAACAIEGCLGTRSTGRYLIYAGIVVALVPVLMAWISQMRGKAGFAGIAREDWLLRLSPAILLVLAGIAMLVFGSSQSTLINPGLPVVIFVIAFAQWPYLARLIRGQVLSLREKEFVEAARSLGASDSRIIFRHILPNLVAPITVYATLLIPANVLFEAALAFLGVGVQPPTASWGAMLEDATSTFSTAWWYMTYPGLALLLTVLAFNLVGDGLQDALNPRTAR